MQKLSIGQMARVNAVSEKTLRLYHELGIFIPAHVDPHSGYRYYDMMQSAQLDLIQTLKDIGVPLRQIKSLQDKGDLSAFRETVQHRQRRIREKQRELDLAMHTVEGLLQSVEAYQSRSCTEQYEVKRFPTRRVLKFDEVTMPNNAESGMDNLEAWERYLRQVKEAMIRKGVPMALFHHVGRTIPLEALKRRDFGTCRALVFVDEHFREAPCATIPEGTYLTMCCHSMVDESGGCNVGKCLHRLLDEAEERGFEVIGDLVGEVIAESAAFGYPGRDMMLELQMPVQER
ncbi:MAG: MerR family transcriptional regulator [Christensenellales bacterium]|jgi:DNA-binding transcriptional MerR regulator